jgi:rhomboid family GlyGly-CTERM serine protease
MKRVPWLTLAAGGAATASRLFPAGADKLVYDRAAVLTGEGWRLATAPLVHFSAEHLMWNFAVLGTAGWIAEGGARWRYAAVFALSSFLPCLYYLLLFPECARCGGLSGVATGVLVWFALEEVRRGGSSRLPGIVLVLLVTGKIATETMLNRPLFAELESVVPAIDAHWIGAAAGAVVSASSGRRSL